MSKVAFLGLGKMGSGMADCIVCWQPGTNSVFGSFLTC